MLLKTNPYLILITENSAFVTSFELVRRETSSIDSDFFFRDMKAKSP
jgi:hypothetical protein